MSDLYNTFKALHIIFVTTWFAGLFYVPRLFIYTIEANEKSAEAKEHLMPQLLLMTRRLMNIITWPSAVLATLFALVLLFLQPVFLQLGWMHIKLAFVIALWWYHIRCHNIAKDFYKGIINYSSKYMRIWNEVATVILFAVVFLVVLRSSINWIYGTVGLIALSLLLMIGIKAYKRYREKHPNR